MKNTFIFEWFDGPAGQGIIQAVEKSGSEMVIMGTRGLGKIKRTILGSVSDYVVHHTNVPVLICPL